MYFADIHRFGILMLKGVGKIIRMGRAYTMFISVPADIVKDGAFPFDREKGEPVIIEIRGERLIVERKK